MAAISQTDHVAANLPAIDFEQTLAFYQTLGFEVDYYSDQWMILHRGMLQIEFFPYSELDPQKSYHSASVWMLDLDDLYQSWMKLNWQNYPSHVRMTEISLIGNIRVFNLIDVNGSLLRCMSLQ